MEIPEGLRKAKRPTLLIDGDPGTPPNVALVSSSFDPLTLGHVALAEAAFERADLVLLTYSLNTLPKEGDAGSSLLSDRMRIDLLERWSASRPGTGVACCSHGLLADQASAAAECFPDAVLYLVVGSDKALQLADPKWYRERDAALSRLFASAGILYAERAGDEGAVEAMLAQPGNSLLRDHFERLSIPSDAAAISSRDVRQRARRGEAFEHLVPLESAEAIRAALAVDVADDEEDRA